MKRLFIFLAAAMMAAGAMAEEHSYVWSEEYPNYKQQIPSSDFTTNDGLFRFTSDKATGISGPQFGADSKAGLLLRLYADNTLRIESLSGAKITNVTFVIGGNEYGFKRSIVVSDHSAGDYILNILSYARAKVSRAPGAVGRFLGNGGSRPVIPREFNALVGKGILELCEEKARDILVILLCKVVEHHNLVNSADELGPQEFRERLEAPLL